MRSTLIFAGVLGAATAAQADIIAVWNFNDSIQNTAPDLVVDRTLDEVAATLTTNFADGTTNSFTGTTVNAREGDPAGLDFALQNGESGVNNGRYLQVFLQSTTLELSDLSLSLAGRRSNSGFNSNQLSYSFDGVNFTNFGSPITFGTGYADVTMIDLSSLDALDGQDEIYLRLTFSGGSTTSTTGNNRIDNLVIEGTAQPVPEPASMLALGIGALGLLARRRRK